MGGAVGGAAVAAAVIARNIFEAALQSLDVAASAALFAGGVSLASKAQRQFRDATDALVDLNACREEMACEIHRRNLTTNLPFQNSAMRIALDIQEPTPNYNGLCSFFHNLQVKRLFGAREAADNYSELFCIKPSFNRREFDYFTGLSSVDASYARVRSQERREELLRESKVSAVQSTHAGTFNSPQGVFGLIENAAGIYGYIQQQAAGSFAGAGSLVAFSGTALAGQLVGGNG